MTSHYTFLENGQGNARNPCSKEWRIRLFLQEAPLAADNEVKISESYGETENRSSNNISQYISYNSMYEMHLPKNTIKANQLMVTYLNCSEMLLIKI